MARRGAGEGSIYTRNAGLRAGDIPLRADERGMCKRLIEYGGRLLVAAVVSSASVGNAADVSGYLHGADLHGYCIDRSAAGQMRCSYYVAGVADATSVRGEVRKHRTSDGRFSFCTPLGSTVPQLAEVVTKWLDDRPETWHYGAAGLVAAALMESFPCK